jgi:hypothetical protein
VARELGRAQGQRTSVRVVERDRRQRTSARAAVGAQRVAQWHHGVRAAKQIELRREV